MKTLKPSFFRFILLCMIVYMASYFIVSATDNLSVEYIGFQVGWIIVCSVIFTLGLIQLGVYIKLAYRFTIKLLKRMFNERI